MRLFGSCLLLVCALWACAEQGAPPANGEIPREECRGRSDGLYCSDDEALHCRTGEVAQADDCAERGRVCVPSTGCLVCAPASYGCDGNVLLRCAADGAEYVERESCAEGLSCSREGCADLCARAERERSYIGCEYFPVFTSNNQLDTKFKPAVVIANPNLVAAEVSISRGEALVEQLQVAPGDVQTVMLEFVEALRSPSGSAVVRAGAYHVVSSVPVTVHQFNPLLFEVDEDCARDESGRNPGEVGDDKCNSYSNDASLLLPSHALVRDAGQSLSYLANTRASFLVSELPEGPYHFPSPGFVTVVATGARAVHVKITSSAYTIPSINYVRPNADAGAADPDAGAPDAEVDAGQDAEPSAPEPPDTPVDSVAPLAPGQDLDTVTLMPGDVLQLLSDSPLDCAETPISTRKDFVCPVGADFDLTGTVIEADGPVQVIAGHNCSYVPLDRVACDHLEETMFPVDTWGVEVIAARPRGSAQLPHVLRVLSAHDDNRVTFSPNVHDPVTLRRGEALEIISNEHVLVSAQKPISVAQYLVGQDGQGTVGDPSMSIAIPVEQYRSSYAFLSPATYTINYVNIIAQAGDLVVLDGLPVTGFVPVADGAYQAAAVPLARSGVHEVHSALGLGIGVVLYGYGDYTSYMLPGGLDLRPINVLF